MAITFYGSVLILVLIDLKPVALDGCLKICIRVSNKRREEACHGRS